MSLIQKFQLGLKKTSNYFTDNIFKTLSIQKIDDEILNELETILLSSDIGIEVTNLLIEKIKFSKISKSKDYQEILKIIANEIEIIFKSK